MYIIYGLKSSFYHFGIVIKERKKKESHNKYLQNYAKEFDVFDTKKRAKTKIKTNKKTFISVFGIIIIMQHSGAKCSKY